jgi:streptogramin lyase
VTRTSHLLAHARRLLPLGLLLGLAWAAHRAAGRPPLPGGPGETVYPLPRDTIPRHLALAGDGSVWTTDEYGGVTRLSPDGATKDFLRHDEFISDIAAGPDGSIWVADDVQAVRIAPTGIVRRRQVGGRGVADAITSAGGAVWVANEGNVAEGYRPRIERVSGAPRVLVVPSPRQPFTFNGIAGAPDGSLWFTENGDHSAWIGRMSANGGYLRWALARGAGAAGRIAAGADGAMWFTEAHAIGRISSSGQATSFSIGGGAAPHDIAAGGDGNVWFTSDICLARIGISGQITTWPVPGAVQLEGIAAAGDGSFWLADRAGNAVRRFDPSVAMAAPCGAATLSRVAGPTAATLSFERSDRFGGVDYFTDIHIRLARDGRDLFGEAVPGLRGDAAFSDSTALSLSDLDGDAEPEVMLLLNTNGLHCCSWSRIYRFNRARNTYTAGSHFWGSGGAEPVLRDLDGDHVPELISLDDRFEERFASFAVSVRPVQIWAYRKGRLRDVTRRHLGLVRRDAARIWRIYIRHRRTDARGILPAWVADEYLLGRAAFADRVLERAAARGELERGAGVGPRDPQAYIRAVKALLRRTGYSPASG